MGSIRSTEVSSPPGVYITNCPADAPRAKTAAVAAKVESVDILILERGVVFTM